MLNITHRAMTSKLTAVFVLFLLVFMCSWLPGKLMTFLHHGLDNSLDQQRLQQVLTGMNCFAGGVFLATIMLDLLPGLRKVVTGANEELEKHGEDDTLHPEKYSEITPGSPRAFAFGPWRRLLVQFSNPAPASLENNNESHEKCVDRHFVHDTPLNRLRRGLHSSLKANTFTERYNSKSETQTVTKQTTVRSLDPSIIILLLILSVHCIFDGLTVGLNDHPPVQALEVTIAVAIHKCVFA